MWFSSWLRNRKRPAPPRKRAVFRPGLEALEDRWLPSTLTVLNTADSGPGSLRAEIAAANKGDTIAFASGLDGQTITLTSGELVISKSLTIQGFTSFNQLPVTVSGGGAWRVFEVNGANTTVSLSGLTISQGNGNADSFSDPYAGFGGGLLNFGKLTLSHCTVSGNTTIVGGGIENAGGTLTLSDCTLSGNAAASAGGIFNGYMSSLTVSESILSANSAIEGGGIFNGGTLSISASTLSGNSALYGDPAAYGGGDSGFNDGFGGGLFNAGSATVTGCTLSGNSANYGGGIYNSGTLAFSGTLYQNSAVQAPDGNGGDGGGLYNAGKATIESGSTVQLNTATVAGGGLFNAAGASLKIEGSGTYIQANGAPTGADVYNLGHLTLAG
jgi:hypothetical protein